jgi:hypothetical protein
VHLGVVAAGVAPLGQRGGVLQLRGLVVALHHHQLGGVQPGRGLADPQRRDREQEVPDRGLVPDAAHELAHDAEPAAGGHGALLRGQVTGDQPQQRGLSRPVRPDERGNGALTDTERHIIEKLPAIRQRMTDMRGLHMAH